MSSTLPEPAVSCVSVRGVRGTLRFSPRAPFFGQGASGAAFWRRHGIASRGEPRG